MTGCTGTDQPLLYWLRMLKPSSAHSPSSGMLKRLRRRIIAQDDATLLEAAIATLPAPFRETLMLREVQELGYREIADVTGVSIGTVMSRLSPARRRVISKMTKREPGQIGWSGRSAAPLAY